MRIDVAKPISGFLSAEKDTNLVVEKILNNERLKRLLHYTTPDCLSRPNLTEKETMELIGKNIKIIPKLTVDNTVLNYMIITFPAFLPNATNPKFRDNTIEIDIVCHFDQWTLKDFQIRPYKIAAEVDSMLNEQRLTGIGKLKFKGAVPFVLTSEFGGVCLQYEAIHGEEDRKFLSNPADEERFMQDFAQMQQNNG